MTSAHTPSRFTHTHTPIDPHTHSHRFIHRLTLRHILSYTLSRTHMHILTDMHTSSHRLFTHMWTLRPTGTLSHTLTHAHALLQTHVLSLGLIHSETPAHTQCSHTHRSSHIHTHSREDTEKVEAVWMTSDPRSCTKVIKEELQTVVFCRQQHFLLEVKEKILMPEPEIRVEHSKPI